VPCATPDEVAALLRAAAASVPVAAFAPSRSGRGTNGVALSPPDAMPLTFGEPSFDRHLAAARGRGLTVRVLELPGLGLDIDDPEDLRALLGEGGATESGRLLATWRIASRLGTDRVPGRLRRRGEAPLRG
jgi:2-phospho-L-lactate guanylyltransferase (CobY/MobA/RfbA family)